MGLAGWLHDRSHTVSVGKVTDWGKESPRPSYLLEIYSIHIKVLRMWVHCTIYIDMYNHQYVLNWNEF